MQGGGPVPAAAPQKKGISGKTILRIGLVVVVVVVAIIGWFASRSEPANAKVGDCISGQTADSMKIVDCADATAVNKVVGRVESKTAEEFDANLEGICQPYPTAESGFWQGKEGKNQKGIVLCLEPVKR